MCKEVTQRCLIHRSPVARSPTAITISFLSLSLVFPLFSVLFGHKIWYKKSEFLFFFGYEIVSVQLVPGGVREMI